MQEKCSKSQRKRERSRRRKKLKSLLHTHTHTHTHTHALCVPWSSFTDVHMSAGCEFPHAAISSPVEITPPAAPPSDQPSQGARGTRTGKLAGVNSWSLSLTHTLSLSISLSHSHSHSISISLYLTLSLSLSIRLSLSLSLSLSYTHSPFSHVLSFSFPCPPLSSISHPLFGAPLLSSYLSLAEQYSLAGRTTSHAAERQAMAEWCGEGGGGASMTE